MTERVFVVQPLHLRLPLSSPFAGHFLTLKNEDLYDDHYIQPVSESCCFRILLQNLVMQ